MIRVLRAFAGGLWAVACAPWLVAGVALVTLATAVPFGVAMGARLQTALAHQPPIALGSGEIDPEWWLEFRARARGLDATFTPSVIGFAAPLGNLSALLDGTSRPLALAGPVALAGLVWAFLWGGLLDRFTRGRPSGLSRFCMAGGRLAPGFAAISATAALASLALYLTVHAALFGPVYEWLASQAASERDAFMWRVGLYAIFAVLLAIVSLIADFARVSTVVAGMPNWRAALGGGARFVRAHGSAVFALYLLAGALFAALLAAYGTLEKVGGVRVGGWRGVLLAQVYIVARIGLRLGLAAAEVRLFEEPGDTPSLGAGVPPTAAEPGVLDAAGRLRV